MYLYSTSTKLSIDVWLYLDRPGSLTEFQIWGLAQFPSAITFKVIQILLHNTRAEREDNRKLHLHTQHAMVPYTTSSLPTDQTLLG